MPNDIVGLSLNSSSLFLSVDRSESALCRDAAFLLAARDRKVSEKLETQSHNLERIGQNLLFGRAIAVVCDDSRFKYVRRDLTSRERTNLRRR